MVMSFGQRSFAGEKFSKWPLNSKWPPCFLKDVIVDYSNTTHPIGLKFYMVIAYDQRISYLVGKNGTSVEGRIFNVAAQI